MVSESGKAPEDVYIYMMPNNEQSEDTSDIQGTVAQGINGCIRIHDPAGKAGGR